MSNMQSESNSTESQKLSGLLMRSLSELLERTTCMELVKNQNVVVIPADIDVTSACQVILYRIFVHDYIHIVRFL